MKTEASITPAKKATRPKMRQHRPKGKGFLGLMIGTTRPCGEKRSPIVKEHIWVIKVNSNHLYYDFYCNCRVLESVMEL